MASDEAIQAVRDTFGDSTASYLNREADQTARSVLDRSASSFMIAQRSVDLSLSAAEPALDLGGAETNSFSVLAPVSAATEDAVATLLLEDQDKAEATACFVTHRFFDVELSEQMKRPIVGYCPGIIANTYLPSRLEPNTCRVAVLDRIGSAVLLTENIETLRSVGTGPAVLDRTLPRRDDRLSAYGDRLVAVDPDGEKVYFTTKVVDRWEEPSIGFGGLRGTTYEAVELTDITAGDKSAKDLAPLPPDAPQLLQGGGTFVRDGYRIPGALLGTRPPSVTWVEGSSGQFGYGPEENTSLGFGPCTHFNARDACVSCCNGTQTAGVAAVTGAGVACAIAAWAFVVACALATAVGVAVFMIGGDTCRRNCNLPVMW